MRDFDMPEDDNYSGQLLIAHPGLEDSNFSRTVVLISAHTPDEGSLGVILNRPLGKTIGEEYGDYAYGPLSDIPLYLGGPVQEDEMILTAWYWESNSRIFRLYFGIDESKALEIKMLNPDAEFRAFLGYAGWEKGQLEEELSQDAWLVSAIEAKMSCSSEGERYWKRIISKISPELGFIADLPDDPSRN